MASKKPHKECRWWLVDDLSTAADSVQVTPLPYKSRQAAEYILKFVWEHRKKPEQKRDGFYAVYAPEDSRGKSNLPVMKAAKDFIIIEAS